jgi:hypothetical protein
VQDVFDEDIAMPMMDVYAAADLIPADTGRQLELLFIHGRTPDLT